MWTYSHPASGIEQIEMNGKADFIMSPMDKMWLSFYAMGFMFVSMGLIFVSRHKLKSKLLKFISATIAYVLLLFCFFAMIYLVFSGPGGSA